MKALIPSHREDKRYLLINGKNLRKNIEKAIIEFSGIHGISKAGLLFISLNSSDDSAIICINRKSLDLVKAGLVTFPERLDVLKVSGTLKGLKK